MNIGILGAGIWGKTIGKLAEVNKHRVFLIHHTDSDWPAEKLDMLFIALPVQNIRETLQKFPPLGVPVLSLSKGLEIETGYRVSQIVADVWPGAAVGSLSGPTLAAEISKGLPAAAVIAATDDALAESFQRVLHQATFRLYRSTDLIGVEIGGALKNVYAIAGGACAQMQFGENAMAGLLTRCVAEMARIGVHAGGRPETFAGLSGMGDLILTATSSQSRNHRMGRLLAQGISVDEALRTLGGVVEGVPTTQSAYLSTAIPNQAKPIIAQVYGVLHEAKPLQQSVRDLLSRAMTAE